MKTFLHVGCGPKRKDRTTAGFNTPDWAEVRLDIDPKVVPDVVGSILDMPMVETGSMDALFSAHNLEHLYPHEVPQALAEFRRVVKPDGFVVITCPDLKSICALVAKDKLLEPAYTSSAGPIAPVDVIYGLRKALAKGNHFMAHRGGFTEKTLIKALISAGFGRVVSVAHGHPKYAIWALATAAPLDRAALGALASQHFPRAPRLKSDTPAAP